MGYRGRWGIYYLPYTSLTCSTGRKRETTCGIYARTARPPEIFFSCMCGHFPSTSVQQVSATGRNASKWHRGSATFFQRWDEPSRDSKTIVLIIRHHQVPERLYQKRSKTTRVSFKSASCHGWTPWSVTCPIAWHSSSLWEGVNWQ